MNSGAKDFLRLRHIQRQLERMGKPVRIAAMYINPPFVYTPQIYRQIWLDGEAS